jgi:hypothetical protein
MREKGLATLELAFILPILAMMAFGIVDIGRLIQASLIVTNVSREGGSLASRGFRSEDALLSLLQSSGSPLDLNGSGKIYVSRIKAGKSRLAPNPSIDPQFSRGGLNVSTDVQSGLPGLGLSDALYQRLVFDEVQKGSDIAEVWVVEVYYNYRPITPLPRMIEGILATPGYDGRIVRGKSIF